MASVHIWNTLLLNNFHFHTSYYCDVQRLGTHHSCALSRAWYTVAHFVTSILETNVSNELVAHGRNS